MLILAYKTRGSKKSSWENFKNLFKKRTEKELILQQLKQGPSKEKLSWGNIISAAVFAKLVHSIIAYTDAEKEREIEKNSNKSIEKNKD